MQREEINDLLDLVNEEIEEELKVITNNDIMDEIIKVKSSLTDLDKHIMKHRKEDLGNHTFNKSLIKTVMKQTGKYFALAIVTVAFTFTVIGAWGYANKDEIKNYRFVSDVVKIFTRD